MVKSILRKIYLKNYRFKKVKVLGRVACLGTDVLKLLGFERGLANHQKNRIDYLLDIAVNSKHKVKADVVIKFLAKKYIADCIIQQEENFFNYRKPDLIFIDSFSELTDQLFVNKLSSTRFLANYSDVGHSENFKKEYDCQGLMQIDELSYYYEVFFRKLFAKYPNVPVFFLHFPTKLDKRTTFKDRGNTILNVIDKLSVENSLLYSIKVADELVAPSEDETDELRDFPYHYHSEMYQLFANQISATIKRQEYLHDH